jgi:hypothetical protein
VTRISLFAAAAAGGRSNYLMRSSAANNARTRLSRQLADCVTDHRVVSFAGFFFHLAPGLPFPSVYLYLAPLPLSLADLSLRSFVRTKKTSTFSGITRTVNL